jgi:hypothetical protein
VCLKQTKIPEELEILCCEEINLRRVPTCYGALCEILGWRSVSVKSGEFQNGVESLKR